MKKSMILSKIGINTGLVSYSKEANAFLTSGYTSCAGNTYYNVVRIANGLAIIGGFGDGKFYTFLNSLRIYSLKDQTLIAERRFGSYVHSNSAEKGEIKSMLLAALKEAAKSQGWTFNEKEAMKEIKQVVDECFSTNQVLMLKKQTQKYLKG